MKIGALFISILAGSGLAGAPLLRAQVYEEMLDFTKARLASAENKGSAPVASLVQGLDGNFYGTTVGGGLRTLPNNPLSGAGTIFRVAPAGELTVLVEFTGTSGANKGALPRGNLVLGQDGNFYGTTAEGGVNDLGTVFRMTPEGVLTTLVEFTGNGASNRGARPFSGLVQGRDGDFYGTTFFGGPNDYGTVFRMTPAGVLTTLLEFTGEGGVNKGDGPRELMQDSEGNFYGMTIAGGVNGFGTIFKMTASGVLTTLVEFAGVGPSNQGAYPYPALVQGSDGNFYGTTAEGGASNVGLVFKMTPTGALTTLVEFTGTTGARKGAELTSGLRQGSDGALYGTTEEGGANDLGTVFKVNLSGEFTTLVEFTGAGASNRGAAPRGGVVQGSDGNFYGTTRFGGALGAGTVFRMTPEGVLTTLVEFTGAGASEIGAGPSAGLTQGDEGYFYGTTRRGGSNDRGTVFRASLAGELQTLVEFTDDAGASPGAEPLGGLVRSSDGNFYGTTSLGGNGNRGTVFRITPAGELTTLVLFAGNGVTNRGASPYAGLVEGGDGNFYGTTTEGGTSNAGTVFRMTPSGQLSTLVEFTGNGIVNKGAFPTAALLMAADGNFYGTTVFGGAGNFGTVFRMTPAGELVTLVQFTGNGGTRKGASPTTALVQAGDGDFYGTTFQGGANDFGTVFKMTPAGALTTLVEFTGAGLANRGRGPNGVVQRSDGHFYGTTGGGGASNEGTLFQMSAAGTLTTIREFLGDLDGSQPSSQMVFAEDGNLYGVTSGDFVSGGGGTTAGTIFRLIFPGTPTVLVSNFALQGASGALLEAHVNPRGALTSVVLEYGTDGLTFPETVPLAVGLSGFQTKLIGTMLGELNSGTKYFLRLRATSSAGTTLSAVQSFSTLAEPGVAALPASEVAPTSARFNGLVNARNFNTTVAFEWGLDGNSYPNTAPATPGTVTGGVEVPVSAAVAGLPPGGTVFFRLRAMNAGGTVTSGVRSFSTVSVTTSNPLSEQVGVTEAIFRATINTFGRTASVKFKYWPTATPQLISETATQLVTSTGPMEVTHREPTLLENVSYSYQVSVELAGTETDGGPVSFTTQQNQAPAAMDDLVFYAGQVVVDPLENDSDPNDGSNTNLKIDTTLVVPPNASRGSASVTLPDRRFISYNPAFNIRDDDTLTYRVRDALGATADGQVRLIAFSKRAGLYGGRMNFGSEPNAREGQVAVQMGSGGLISTSFMAWPSMGEGVRESFVLKGQFDQRGRLSRTLNSPSGAVLTLTLQLDADQPRMLGTFEERVNNVSTTGVISFVLTKNGGTGGLAESGLRTGYLSPPPELAGTMSEGFVRMTIGKDAGRGARFAGRMPDGEPFLASAKAQGRAYELTRKLEQRGLITGLVRAVNGSGMMGDLYWGKRANGKARFHRGGVESMLSLSGVAYPVIARGGLPPLELGAGSPNARVRLSGGDLSGSYRDVLVNIRTGGVVQIVGPDLKQVGADLKSLDTSKVTIKVDGPQATFTGKFLHPETGKPVTFEGAFRAPFDTEPAQGRGVFRGPSAAGAVRIEGN